MPSLFRLRTIQDFWFRFLVYEANQKLSLRKVTAQEGQALLHDALTLAPLRLAGGTTPTHEDANFTTDLTSNRNFLKKGTLSQVG